MTYVAPFSFLLSTLYARGVRVRAWMYERGFFETHTLSAPVVSVGNLTVGGTGKTPVVRWLAQALASEICFPQTTLHAEAFGTYKPCICILTRGYGRMAAAAMPSGSKSGSNDKFARVIVSDGRQVLAGAREGGDEPRQLAEQLLGIASVISDADRVAAAKWACANLNPRLFILDDGFQHLRVRKDFNVCVISATQAFTENRLLPAGRLREPLTALRRADAVILTRTEQLENSLPPENSALLESNAPIENGAVSSLPPLHQNMKVLLDNIKRFTEHKPIFISRTVTREVTLLNSLDDLMSPADFKAHCRVAAFCAIADALSFFTHLRRDGWQVAHTESFRDHHAYRPAEIARIEASARRAGAEALITTAKDAVKLQSFNFTLPCLVLDIDLQIDDSARLLQLILARIKQTNDVR